MCAVATFEHPEEIGSITPDWLQRVLAPALAGAEIAAVKVLAQHSGTTGRARLGLEYAAGPRGPESVFVKLPPFEAEQRKLVAATDMGRKEARFYASLSAEVPVRVPRCWFAAYGDERTQYIMVLEDLEASGCTFPDDVDAHSRERGADVVAALAQLHAHFWRDERFGAGDAATGTLSWVPRAMRGAVGAALVERAREQFGAEMPPVFSNLCELYARSSEAICDLWDEGPETLIHGDIHSGNQFVDGDRIGFYDWAVLSRSPGIRDVGIFLCNSCAPEVRRAEGDRWLADYHRGLVEAGVTDAPSLRTLQLRLRWAVLYGWVAATTTAAVGDRWQPLEIGMAAMRRSTEACDDLGTLDAIRDALGA